MRDQGRAYHGRAGVESSPRPTHSEPVQGLTAAHGPPGPRPAWGHTPAANPVEGRSGPSTRPPPSVAKGPQPSLHCSGPPSSQRASWGLPAPAAARLVQPPRPRGPSHSLSAHSRSPSASRGPPCPFPAPSQPGMGAPPGPGGLLHRPLPHPFAPPEGFLARFRPSLDPSRAPLDPDLAPRAGPPPSPERSQPLLPSERKDPIRRFERKCTFGPTPAHPRRRPPRAPTRPLPTSTKILHSLARIRQLLRLALRPHD